MADSRPQQQIEYDAAKFTELLLYVASRLLGDRSNGSVKRNKVLFFADFIHYAANGRPITGAEYVAQPLGPAPRGIRRLEQQLVDEHQAEMAVVHGGARTQKMLVALRRPDLSLFTGPEVAVVEDVITVLQDATAMEVSEVSHAWLAWQIANQGELIPYHWVFLYEGPVSLDEIRLAQQVETDLSSELASVAAETA
ncbi:MAG: SocA family protein [Actinobacteria bacterium]|nr:SocA family protein [Actinomycetota bacterium]